MADIIQNPTLSKLRRSLLLSLKTFVGFVEEYGVEKRAQRYYIFTSVAPRQCFKTSTLYRIDRQDATAVWHDFELAFRLRSRVQFN